MGAVIEKLLPLDQGDAAFMRGFSDVAMHNWNGIEVGHLRAAGTLRKP